MLDSNLDLQELRRGDDGAWTQAFETLWGFAYHAALNPQAALTPDEAEDVAVDALAKLVPRIGNVASWEHVKALVVTIAHRQAVSLARRKSAAKRPDVAVHLDALPDGVSESLLNRELPDNPFTELQAAELLALLQQALGSLDATTRHLLTGHHLEGLTFRELSQKLNLPPGTVSVKIARGLERIRLRLRETPRLLKELQAFLR
jgi:RNA polymerase sigma factor (sigma-70 family)